MEGTEQLISIMDPSDSTTVANLHKTSMVNGGQDAYPTPPSNAPIRFSGHYGDVRQGQRMPLSPEQNPEKTDGLGIRHTPFASRLRSTSVSAYSVGQTNKRAEEGATPYASGRASPFVNRPDLETDGGFSTTLSEQPGRRFSAFLSSPQSESKVIAHIVPDTTIFPANHPRYTTKVTGADRHFRQGFLLIASKGMLGMISNIAKYYGLPQTSGICLYLISDASDVFGPRITEEVWKMLIGSYENSRPPMLKLGFSLDLSRANRWYEKWLLLGSPIKASKTDMEANEVDSPCQKLATAMGQVVRLAIDLEAARASRLSAPMTVDTSLLSADVPAEHFFTPTDDFDKVFPGSASMQDVGHPEETIRELLDISAPEQICVHPTTLAEPLVSVEEDAAVIITQEELEQQLEEPSATEESTLYVPDTKVEFASSSMTPAMPIIPEAEEEGSLVKDLQEPFSGQAGMPIVVEHKDDHEPGHIDHYVQPVEAPLLISPQLIADDGVYDGLESTRISTILDTRLRNRHFSYVSERSMSESLASDFNTHTDAFNLDHHFFDARPSTSASPSREPVLEAKGISASPEKIERNVLTLHHDRDSMHHDRDSSHSIMTDGKPESLSDMPAEQLVVDDPKAAAKADVSTTSFDHDMSLVDGAERRASKEEDLISSDNLTEEPVTFAMPAIDDHVDDDDDDDDHHASRTYGADDLYTDETALPDRNSIKSEQLACESDQDHQAQDKSLSLLPAAELNDSCQSGRAQRTAEIKVEGEMEEAELMSPDQSESQRLMQEALLLPNLSSQPIQGLAPLDFSTIRTGSYSTGLGPEVAEAGLGQYQSRNRRQAFYGVPLSPLSANGDSHLGTAFGSEQASDSLSSLPSAPSTPGSDGHRSRRRAAMEALDQLLSSPNLDLENEDADAIAATSLRKKSVFAPTQNAIAEPDAPLESLTEAVPLGSSPLAEASTALDESPEVHLVSSEPSSPAAFQHSRARASTQPAGSHDDGVYSSGLLALLNALSAEQSGPAGEGDGAYYAPPSSYFAGESHESTSTWDTMRNDLASPRRSYRRRLMHKPSPLRLTEIRPSSLDGTIKVVSSDLNGRQQPAELVGEDPASPSGSQPRPALTMNLRRDPPPRKDSFGASSLLHPTSLRSPSWPEATAEPIDGAVAQKHGQADHLTRAGLHATNPDKLEPGDVPTMKLSVAAAEESFPSLNAPLAENEPSYDPVLPNTVSLPYLETPLAPVPLAQTLMT